MRTVRTHTDAWTYYEFGAWSFHDQIGAAIIYQLDQSPDRDAVLPKLGEQATGSAFPIIAVGPRGVEPTAETVDAQSLRDEACLLFARYGNQDAVAVTYLSERSQLLAKLRNIFAREMAAHIIDAVLDRSDLLQRIPPSTSLGEIRQATGPDR